MTTERLHDPTVPLLAPERALTVSHALDERTDPMLVELDFFYQWAVIGRIVGNDFPLPRSARELIDLRDPRDHRRPRFARLDLKRTRS